MVKKTMIIHAPEGYEIDEVNSTLREVVFKPIKKKKLTYEDIAKELFEKKETFWATSYGSINCNIHGVEVTYSDANNCTSEKQAKKLLAINQLMNVCKYLNDGWKPDWNDEHESKWFPEEEESDINVDSTTLFNCRICYFKSKELAKQAIEILGEDTVKLALSTDW